ncbi:MAG: ECF transporter S component [Clostridia bacterium]|nr:ECF transporter S component [Clostridia bacterium]
MSNKKNLTRLVFSALFLALAMILPFFTGQIPEIGAMLCPMHIPVILCGFVCSWKWGLAVGFTAPILRSVIMNGMPPMFPTAVCMAFELAVYGLVSGIMYRILPKKKLYIYVSLIAAMLAGRIVWGIAMFTCMGIKGSAFGFGAFMAGAFTNALPGIIVQLVLIPVVVMMLQKTKVMKTEK